MVLGKSSDQSTMKRWVVYLFFTHLLIYPSLGIIASNHTIPWVKGTTLSLYISSYSGFRQLDTPTIDHLWSSLQMEQRLNQRVLRWSVEAGVHPSLYWRLMDQPLVLFWFTPYQGLIPDVRVEDLFLPEALPSIMHSAIEGGGMILPYFEGVEVVVRSLIKSPLITFRSGNFIGFTSSTQWLNRTREQQIYREAFPSSTMIYAETPLQVLEARSQSGYVDVDVRSQPSGSHRLLDGEKVFNWIEARGIPNDSLYIHWISPAYYRSAYPRLFPDFTFDSEWDRMMSQLLDRSELVVHEETPEKWLIVVYHPSPLEEMKPFFSSWALSFNHAPAIGDVIALNHQDPGLWIRIDEDRISFSNSEGSLRDPANPGISPRSPPSNEEMQRWAPLFSGKKTVHFGVWFQRVFGTSIIIPFFHTQESRIDRTTMRIH